MGTTIQEEVRQGLGAWYDALPQDAITAAENRSIRRHRVELIFSLTGRTSFGRSN